jgi:predicted nicotinamide N-methyase
MMALCSVILPLEHGIGVVTAFIMFNRDDHVLYPRRRTSRPGRRGVSDSPATAILGIGSAVRTSSLSMAIPPSSSSSSFNLHTVDGVTCREVYNDFPLIGTVTVLEATAQGQEELVNEILLAMEIDCPVDDADPKKPSTRKRIVKDDPYGAVLWPAAWAVSNYLITATSSSGSRGSIASRASGILELGTGTGLVSISAAVAGAKRVVATDYEPLALELTRYAAERLNVPANDGGSGEGEISSRIETRLLDVCDLDVPLPIHGSGHDDNDGPNSAPPIIDVVVAADIMYEPRTGAMLAHRAVEALRQNCRVIVGDSPGRAGRPAFLQTLEMLGVKGCAFQDTVGKTCSGPRHNLICGEGSLSVSDTPKELKVAILDLHPGMLEGMIK